MADTNYFVALPFVAADDGVAPGEPVECLSARAAILSRGISLAARGDRRIDRIQPQR